MGQYIVYISSIDEFEMKKNKKCFKLECHIDSIIKGLFSAYKDVSSVKSKKLKEELKLSISALFNSKVDITVIK